MQSPSQKSQRGGHVRRPSLSFQPLYFPVDRQFPLYAHCNASHHQRTARPHYSSSFSLSTRRPDLMQTIDYRYTDKCRRSSFALCDIFELEEEEVEIEISSVLPSAPDSACSISTTQSVKNRMKAVLIDLVHTCKTTWSRAHSTRMQVVEPADRSVRVDLL